MRLPRDMETYGSILKAMRSLQKRPVSGSLKPDFNHPIDWELALRIPVNQEIKLITNRGEIRIELWINEAPGSVTQFIKLIKNSFYSNKRLHRVVPGFVIQDGCPRGDGYGSTMETVRSEFSPNATFERGTLGFASAGEDTESCQWFITHTRTPHLNGRYTAFGRVVQGMDVVNQLILGDEIKTIELIAP
jgi:cyclophilin family peptidyl-prolyl cis-trans isomerase